MDCPSELLAATTVADLAAFGDAVYWTTPGAVMVCADGTCPDGGPPVELQGDEAAIDPTALAVDDVAIYWINAGSGGQVRAACRDVPAAPSVVIDDELGEPLALTVVGDALYWSTRDGSIRRALITQ